MNCPLDTPDTAQILLDYCSRQLPGEANGILERHMAVCPACREFANNQRAVWQAMDAWEAGPVSADFDSRLYQRIEAHTPWWERLVRPLRDVTMRRAVPAFTLAAVLIVTGIVLERPGVSPVPPPAKNTDHAQVEPIQPEQIENALDTMDVLAEFSRQVRSEATQPKL